MSALWETGSIPDTLAKFLQQCIKCVSLLLLGMEPGK